MNEALGTIVHQDCIAGLGQSPKQSVDLVFADPPFNIGYDYDVYDDVQQRDEYLAWCRRWIGAVYDALKPTGTFWLAIGDEHAAELKLISRETGFHCRSWVVWYYTFGVNCTQKFSRSHAHLFYFVKDAKHFTFRLHDPENRVPSARQLVYADLRANPKGRLPDDTWILRPQDLTDCFTPGEDTWYFPRVAGTFKERAGFHGCQMPEQLLGRIIRACSNEGDVVVDPFSGSATTLVVAKKLGRRFLGFDISEEYVGRGRERLERVQCGDPLDGAPDPLVSVPSTSNGKQRGAARRKPSPAASSRRSTRAKPIPPERDEIGSLADLPVEPSPTALRELNEGVIEAFRETSDGFSLDRVVADPQMNAALLEACRSRGLPGQPRDWNHLLLRLRKSGRLADIPTLRRTEFSWHACDAYLFAAEIALKQMFDSGSPSLDAILCDPELARKFDRTAEKFAPGFSPLEYRWAAFKLRKEARVVRSRAERLSPGQFTKSLAIGCVDWSAVPHSPGLYRIACGPKGKDLYIGAALDLHERLALHFGDDDRLSVWHSEAQSDDLSVYTIAAERNPTNLLALQALLVRRHHPKLNLADFLAV